ncbi:MAG TPA: MBL fold metallo-hydrolase [Solirubrobacterales bacterium]|nr:MBL fold metallo-hydrolase [Solirubrobacterales bacterium]
MNPPASLSYVGHATVRIELDGVRVLTDPVLRSRIGPLRREALIPAGGSPSPPDLVLVSHLHRDHADLASLHRLGRSTRLVCPAGTGRFFARHGFTAVEELAPGGSIEVGSLVVTAVEAVHDGGRVPPRHGPAVGYVIAGTRRVYFAGDTDLFDGMAELGDLDVALLPIWGWGPSLGPGHMDPRRAARAAAMIRPRIVVPIHWGTFYPRFLKHLRPDPLFMPPQEFASAIDELAPEVEVRLLAPGMSTSF